MFLLNLVFVLVESFRRLCFLSRLMGKSDSLSKIGGTAFGHSCQVEVRHAS